MEEETVEKTYVKLNQLEHILKRPDTYVGSTEFQSQQMWVMSRDEEEQFEYRNIEYVPGLYKIFDEILVNAADNYQRDKRMNCIKVVINQEKNYISIQNNGKGIPIQMHKTEKMMVPELIFGHLLTSSNYNDDKKKVTGGRNGYGAKLANIFSKEFTIETADSKNSKKFKKTWRDNMSKSDQAEITSAKEGDYTKISFVPDLRKFHMKRLDDDIFDLMKKRVYDMAGIIGGNVKVFFNGNQIPIKGFQQYCDMYLSANQKMNQDSKIIKVVDPKTNNPRWEVVVSFSEGQFQQVSFANSICTVKGGTHVDHITNQIVDKVLENMKKKKEKGTTIKAFHVKQHLWVFVNALIENPSFDSQTKETLTLKQTAFGSTCTVSDKLVKELIKEGLANHVMLQAKAKEQAKMNKKLSGKKEQRLVGIPKLEDANDAGTRYADQCTLILTEGDSAKSLAMSGIEVVGRDRYGVFPLKGKMLNVRDASTKQITDNQEIQNVMKTMGLKLGQKYQDVKGLRYGSIMIMADQDTDGSHIKGLFVNFIQTFWPTLYRMPGFLKSFITPLIKAKKGNQVQAFYTQQDFDQWLETVENPNKWHFKYYKGLGTSTDKEAQEYFNNLRTHIINFTHTNQLDDEAIELAFNKKKADERKQWLAEYDPKVCVDYTSKRLRYQDFINKELIQFSIADCKRSIPSLCDGLKPGQRKILYSCFKRNLKSEIKVAQLGGYVAEHSAYHHGEASLAQTIVSMAQNFVGANNINYLLPIGQFGGRNQGGKEAASARYIHTNLNKITRVIFPEHDDHVVNYLEDDGQPVEPEFYIPIIPTVLINGIEGIGTGWSTNIPQYNPRHLVEAIKEKLSTEKSFEELIPWYKGFTGDIEVNPKGGFIVRGNYNIVSEDTIEITEIPIKKWTREYKNYLEEQMQSKDGEPDIENLREYHAGNRVHFVIQMTPKGTQHLKDPDSIEKFFKLNSSLNTTNLVLFNHEGKLSKYANISNIMTEYYYQRVNAYERRKEYLISKLLKDLEILQNKKRFILAVINEEVNIRNIKKLIIVTQLQSKGFKMMKDMTKIKSTKLNRLNKDNSNKDNESEEDQQGTTNEQGDVKEYNYLLGMPMWSLTFEKVEELKRLVQEKEQELRKLKLMTVQAMWEEDLQVFEEILDQIEEDEEREIQKRFKQGQKSNSGKQNSKKPAKKSKKQLESDDDMDDFIEDDDSDFGAKKKKPAPKKASQKSNNNSSQQYTPTLNYQTGISSKTQKKTFVPTVSSSQPVKKSGGAKDKNASSNNNIESSQQMEEEIKQPQSQQQQEKKKTYSSSQPEKKTESIFQVDKEKEEKKQKESQLSSILKYLNPSSQASNFPISQTSQTSNNAGATAGADSSQLSLEQRLLLKDSSGKKSTFDKKIKEEKKKQDTPQKKTANKLAVDDSDEEDDNIQKDIFKKYGLNNNNNSSSSVSNIDVKKHEQKSDSTLSDKENDKTESNKEKTLKRKGQTLKKETQKKTKTEKKSKKTVDSDDDDDDEKDSLEDFVASDSDSEAVKPKKMPKKKATASSKPQKEKQEKKVKKSKKKNSSDFDDEQDFDESEGLDKNNIIASQNTNRPSRRAAANTKKYVESDQDEDFDDIENDSSECQF